MVTFIVVTRNPLNKKVVVITKGDDDDLVAEYATEDEAIEMADQQVLCRAWGYRILEVMV